MQIKIQTMGMGLLLACCATSAGAHPGAPKSSLATNPAASQQSPAIDLTLHPAATLQPPPIDLTLHPAAGQLETPSDPVLHRAAALPSGPLPSRALPSRPPASPLQSASAEVQAVARWISESGDNGGLPYLLIDKVNAQVFAFTPAGLLQGATPALLGLARGDRLLAPNSATMAQMSPRVRITPAGRFVSRLAIDSHGKELLVLDYDASISLHAVIKGTPEEHRAERLSSPTSEDNRISFGCINVPEAFYATIVSPTFAHTKGVVYVLPETSPASELFGFQPAGAGQPAPQQRAAAVDARPAARAVPGAVAN